MEFHQRDIVLAHFPFTNLSQTKLRPALILSSKAVNSSYDFVCVQITSRQHSDSLYLRLQENMIEGSLLFSKWHSVTQNILHQSKIGIAQNSSYYTRCFRNRYR